MTIHYFEYTSFIGNLIEGKKKAGQRKLMVVENVVKKILLPLNLKMVAH